MEQIILIPILAISALLIFSIFFTVKQQSAAIVERFGKFTRISHAGLRTKIPLIERVAGRLSLKIQQLDVRM